MKRTKPYEVRWGRGASRGCLVFAYDACGARATASAGNTHTPTGAEVRVTWLKDRPWLDKEREMDEPHVVKHPRTCRACGLWGLLLDTARHCAWCADECTD